jgi:hypothetical protein
MHRRCSEPKFRDFKYYGGRGIQVCERWNSFENFLLDMGVRPKGKTLDRKNNHGNYDPSNCEWASHTAQMVTGQVAQPQRAEIARLKTPARLVELGRGLRLTRSSSGKPPSQ